MFEKNLQSAVNNLTRALEEAELLFEERASKILELYPTRQDFQRRRGSICIFYLETRSESTILSWIAFQELKKELTGDRRCMKNQTTEERAIMAKGSRIDKWIKNFYKKLLYKCYNKFTEKTNEEKTEIVYKQIMRRAFPESRKQVL